MPRPELCHDCKQYPDPACKCVAERTAYDSALADVMALPEVKALTEFYWDAIESLSARDDDVAHALLAIRKLCAPTSERGGENGREKETGDAET